MSQQHPVNVILENWNRMEQETATEIILPCNGSLAWAIGVVNDYPFDTPEQLFASSDAVWRSLSSPDWQQAFDFHPSIQQEKAGEAPTQHADAQAALAAEYAHYSARFGYSFVLCASGQTAEEILKIVRTRLANSPAAELQEAAEQQRRVTQHRLRDWLKLPAVSCNEL